MMYPKLQKVGEYTMIWRKNKEKTGEQGGSSERCGAGIEKAGITWKEVPLSGVGDPNGAYKMIRGTEHDEIYNAVQRACLTEIAAELDGYQKELEEYYRIREGGKYVNTEYRKEPIKPVDRPEPYWAGVRFLERNRPELGKQVLERDAATKNTPRTGKNLIILLADILDGMKPREMLDWIKTTGQGLYSAGSGMCCRRSSDVIKKIGEEAAAWKKIRQESPGGTLDVPSTYTYHDEEFNFRFMLMPDDNYYHWTNHLYCFLSSDTPELLPWRFRQKDVYYETIPEIAARIPNKH